MIFADVPLAEAEGAILAHSLVVDGWRLAKGRVLTAVDIEILRRGGQSNRFGSAHT